MKISLTILTFVYLISLTSASLLISPDPINVESKVNEQQSFVATFTNNHTFPIQDFSFSNLTLGFSQFTLNANETKEINFTITRDQPIETEILSSVKFNYLVEVPSTPQTHNVNITPTGFSPNFIVIHEQDIIVWTNSDTITHTVTGSTFDLSIPAGATAQRVFTELGTMTYQDLVLFFPATIEILNRTSQQAVHNPIYDKTWRVNLKVVADPTELEVENIGGSDFTIEAIGTTEGLFRVKNIGSQIAQSVEVSDNLGWISPEENHFNLAIGQQKFIDYEISPFIFDTNETGKNYTLEINIKALNSEQVNFTINVFVPFFNMETELTEEEKLLNMWERICKNNPSAPLCTGKLEVEGGNGSVTIRDPEVQYNFTTSTILDILRRQRKGEDADERSANRLTIIEETISRDNPEIYRLLNESIARQIENERKYRRDKNVRWIGGFFLLVLAMGTFIAYKIKNFNRKRRIMEGQS